MTAEAKVERAAAKLRVYLGAAPGVGKSYRMLEYAYSLKQQGTDIVIGAIEAHGRAETAALVRDLELIPLKEITYRSVTMQEMDLEAVLARHPQVCVVDDLAHTNVPGSRNRRRYEDVLELLEAGISVMTALDVQYLETLKDTVSRSSNVQVRDSVPDGLLKRADEIVNVDISIDELRARLRAGKIYPPEKVDLALANFFRKGNLTMLRELALRTTAEQVATAAAQYRVSQGLEQAPVPEKVMVCLSPRPGTMRLLRTGARIAGRLATNWFAVYADTPEGERRHGDEESKARLDEFKRTARELGAQLVTLKGKNAADLLIEFAQKENISHVVFGQSARSRFEILLRGSIINRFLAEMRNTTVQVVPMSRDKGPGHRSHGVER
ncbi:MAG TPA: universal stress protein [Silvibacterium sp.]|nr:universal stress protein [Silvibacterium sp.]